MDVIEFLKQMAASFDPAAAAGTNCIIQFMTSKPAYLTIKDGTPR